MKTRINKIGCLSRRSLTRRWLLCLFLLAGWLATSIHAGVVFTSLYSFSGTNDGANPRAGLVQGRDGNFYGTTDLGGTNGYGTVFKITTNGALTSLYSFTGTNDGALPFAGLVQGSDGNFYGTTEAGGTNGNNGTVFKITTNGVLTSLYSFSGGKDGGSLFAGLVQGTEGNLYGTTELGGTNNLGTVFQISTNGTLTSLYSFTGGNDGAYPFVGGLVQGSDGFFYGTTAGQVFRSSSAIFKISTNGALTALSTFSPPVNGNPSRLVQGGDGLFYGTTQFGGTSSDGTVFKISTNGPPNTLHSFSPSDGLNSLGGLVLGSDGNFYGTAIAGGNTNLNSGFGYGTVFKVTTNGTLTGLYSFTGTNDGANPYAGLMQGSDGNFYGTTSGGGTNNLGTVFRLTIVPPELAIIPSGVNIILSWSTNDTGFTLEFATNLASPTIWNTNSTAPVVISGQNVVTNPITGTEMFFRLNQ